MTESPDISMRLSYSDMVNGTGSAMDHDGTISDSNGNMGKYERKGHSLAEPDSEEANGSIRQTKKRNRHSDVEEVEKVSGAKLAVSRVVTGRRRGKVANGMMGQTKREKGHTSVAGAVKVSGAKLAVPNEVTVRGVGRPRCS